MWREKMKSRKEKIKEEKEGKLYKYESGRRRGVNAVKGREE
jgi:hypothetical protein